MTHLRCWNRFVLLTPAKVHIFILRYVWISCWFSFDGIGGLKLLFLRKTYFRIKNLTAWMLFRGFAAWVRFIHFVTGCFTSGYQDLIRSGFFNLSCFNAHIDKIIVFFLRTGYEVRNISKMRLKWGFTILQLTQNEEKQGPPSIKTQHNAQRNGSYVRSFVGLKNAELRIFSKKS